MSVYEIEMGASVLIIKTVYSKYNLKLKRVFNTLMEIA
jgi:hypothetical protein